MHVGLRKSDVSQLLTNKLFHRIYPEIRSKLIKVNLIRLLISIWKRIKTIRKLIKVILKGSKQSEPEIFSCIWSWPKSAGALSDASGFIGYRPVASLTVPGGQGFHFPHFFLKIRSIFLIFPQTLLIFFLIFGPPGGRLAHPGRPWLRHWLR